MKYLSDTGYVYNPNLSIWNTPDFKEISYNDGDEVENRILSNITNANDISVMSNELRKYCIDWPSIYHLSSLRANLLRPLEDILKSYEVLEVGAGCGAITRYLGEVGSKVVGLEVVCAERVIASARNRDLDNVSIVSDNFNNFKCKKKFDLVTLIGVLEYSSMFIDGQEPHLKMLKLAKNFLKPNGKIILAIENQLGIKYFAGSPEDHIGKPMFGIEGRYKSHHPKTFGRESLSNLLMEAGFSNLEFLSPYPDYKLPVSIITEEGFNNEIFDASLLASQSASSDLQMPSVQNFSLELAYPQLFANKLGLEMSNSFLVVASLESSNTIQSDLLAYHYGGSRTPEFSKSIHFKKNNLGSINVKYDRLFSGAKNLENELVKVFFT